MNSFLPWTYISDKKPKIPLEQKAALFDNYGGPIRIDTFPVPEIEHDELLVSIYFSGVCKMDVQIWQGTFPWKPYKLPLVGGHKAVGMVVLVGQDVLDYKVGDYVGIKWVNGTCMSCEFCKLGQEVNCPGVIFSGCSRDGTFCQYTTVKAMNAVSIPDYVDIAMVTAILCEGLTVYRALKESNVRPGQIIAIAGAGGALGRLAIQYARAMGMRVIAIDRSTKESICKDLGAEFFLSFEDSEAMLAEIVRLTNGGPHGALNCSPVLESVEQAIEYVRPHGSVVLTVMPTGNFTVNSSSLVLCCVRVIGSYLGSRQDMDEAINFFARGLIKVEVEVLPLQELEHVYERISNNQVEKHIVLNIQNCG